MKLVRTALLTAIFVTALAAAGCGTPHYIAAPPPPPPYAQVPPLTQLAQHNGFDTGRADGARDVDTGRGYAPRRTRAFHDCPGYDPTLGPFGVYRNIFRNAYLNGYDRGYRRG